MLMDARRQTFVQEGYLVVRDAFGPERASDLQRWTAELLAAPEVPGSRRPGGGRLPAHTEARSPARRRARIESRDR